MGTTTTHAFLMLRFCWIILDLNHLTHFYTLDSVALGSERCSWAGLFCVCVGVWVCRGRQGNSLLRSRDSRLWRDRHWRGVCRRRSRFAAAAAARHCSWIGACSMGHPTTVDGTGLAGGTGLICRRRGSLTATRHQGGWLPCRAAHHHHCRLWPTGLCRCRHWLGPRPPRHVRCHRALGGPALQGQPRRT